MRFSLALLALPLLFACETEDPIRPAPMVDEPVASKLFDVTPARTPGSTVNVTVSFPLAADIVVARTKLTIAGSGADCLPSPWGSLYKINGEILSEGRKLDLPGYWELRLRFRNDSNIVCTSCEDVTIEYRLWD